MRKLIVSSLLALAMLATPACKDPDPNKFETHIERIKDAETRNQGFNGLERLVKTVTTARDNKDLLDEFVEKALPVFEEVWDDAEEHQQKMLTMMRDVGRPEAASLWDRAIELDGSDALRQKTILALDGVKKARATDSTEAIVEELQKLIKSPKLDVAENDEGRLRLMMCQTLGALGDKRAVPVLIQVMEQDRENQPVTVHRAAAEALGRIGDPAAVDALLTVTFRVPDENTTSNIGEKAKVALVGIGEPAVPKVMQVLRGEHGEVSKLAAENGVPLLVIQQTAAAILGTMGAKSAVDELLAYMPMEACQGAEEKKEEEKKKEGEEEEGIDMDESAKGSLRAVIANALGFIGDPKAAPQMCKCVMASNNPGDMYPLMEALGRVGGSEAVTCLAGVIKTGKYDPEAVMPNFINQPRWEAARFAVIAASQKDLPTIKEAMAANTDATVKKELAAWDPAIAMVEKCGDDKGCYTQTLSDVNGDWFAREKAAYQVARSSPGDVKAAEEVAKAFKVRNPDARLSIAWLPAWMLKPGEKCPKCVDAFNEVLEAEKVSMDATYQASVLRVRASVAQLQDVAQADAEGGAEGGAAAAPAE